MSAHRAPRWLARTLSATLLGATLSGCVSSQRGGSGAPAASQTKVERTVFTDSVPLSACLHAG
jgi:hypothetical protein